MRVGGWRRGEEEGVSKTKRKREQKGRKVN